MAVRGPRRMVLPRTPGSLASDVVQKRCVSTATPAASFPSSDLSIRRPRTGRSPITSKYEPLTTPAWTTRGSPKPTMLKPMTEKSPNAVMVVARALKSSISGTENVVFVGAEARRALADVDEAILVAIDERPQQHAADDAEDGGVGADAERQRDDDGGGEPSARGGASGGQPACPGRTPSPLRTSGCTTRAASSRASPARSRTPGAPPAAPPPDPRRARFVPRMASARWPRISSSSSRSSGRMASTPRRADAGS